MFRAATISTLALIILSSLVSNASMGQNKSTLDSYLQRRCFRIRLELDHNPEQKWNALAKFAEGKTTKQLREILPPYSHDSNLLLSAPVVTLWNGQSFLMIYFVDDTFEVKASGYGSVKGDVVTGVNIIRSSP